MKLLIFFLICFEVANLQKSNLINILETNHNFFNKINSNIHTITNKLLQSLKLNRNFTKSTNIHMLSTMHFYFNKIAEENCRVYEKLKNVSNANFGKSRKKTLEEVLKEFQDIVAEEMEKLKNNVTKTAYSTLELDRNYNKTKYNNREKTLKMFFELWSKVGDKTMENIIDPILNENEVPINTERSIYADSKSKNHDLEIWQSQISNGKTVTPNFNTRRIYKGKKTKIKNYPFVVSLHLMSKYLCAGSIISMDMVITAASCLQIAYNNKLYRNNPRTIFVRVGSDYTKRSGELMPIVQVIFHPEYDSITLRNNLAIVKMLKKLKHTKKRKIMRVKYDTNADALTNDVEDVTILGWSSKSPKHKPKGLQRLIVAHLDVYDIEDCREVYSKYYVNEMNFCAGFTSKGRGVCMQDVGGPAVVSGQLVGVVSFGPTVCGMPDAPIVLTKLGYYAKWIESVVNQKPGIKLTAITTSTYSTPEVFVIPLYTTISHVKRVTVPDEAKEYSEEIHVLKKIIQEFILANSSVIDYLTNGEILDDDNELRTGLNHKLLIDPKHHEVHDAQPQFLINDNKNSSLISTKLHEAGKKNNAHNSKSASGASQTLTGYLKSTNPRIDYDEEKKTTLATFVESDEFSEVDYFSNNDEVRHHSNESSSYYELDIPIEDNSFEIKSRSENILIDTKSTIAKTEPKFVQNGSLDENKSFSVYQKSEPVDVRLDTNEYKERYHTRNVSENYNSEISETQPNIKNTLRDYKEYTNDYTTTTMDHLGVTMSISLEDFNYADNEKENSQSNKDDTRYYNNNE